MPAWGQNGEPAWLEIAYVAEGVRHHVDVSIRHAPANHYLRRSAVRDAAAAEAGEADKRERYPADPDAALPEVEPFVLESFGRLGPAAVDLLREARQTSRREGRLQGMATPTLGPPPWPRQALRRASPRGTRCSAKEQPTTA